MAWAWGAWVNLECEELGEGRLSPVLGESSAALHDVGEEEPALDGSDGQGAQQRVELGRAEVHRRVEEAEAGVRDRRLVARWRRVVPTLVKDDCVMSDATRRGDSAKW